MTASSSAHVDLISVLEAMEDENGFMVHEDKVASEDVEESVGEVILKLSGIIFTY
jgi:predicted RNA-binding protein (virulence factor B family)